MSYSEEDWEDAEEHLNGVRSQYASLGAPGLLGLNILNILLARYMKGERTEKLHNEILEAN